MVLERLKKILLRRIEKNAIKSELSWTDTKGKIHNEQVYLKRSRLPLIGDWGRIYPPVNEDGSWNFMNFVFGGKQQFFRTLIVMIILGLLFYQFVSLLGYSREYLDGRKYVIMEKTTFEKFCVTRIVNGETGIIETLPSNITIFRPEINKEPE